MPAPLKYLNNPDCVDVILARWPDDNRFYTVTMVKLGLKKDDTSLVIFEDGVCYPIKNEQLHMRLDLEKINDDSIICCLCDGDKSELPNLIMICDLCQLGYHVGCHQPPIETAFLDETSDNDWYCCTCIEITEAVRKRRSVGKRVTFENQKKTPKRRQSAPAAKTPKKSSSGGKSLPIPDKSANITEDIVPANNNNVDSNGNGSSNDDAAPMQLQLKKYKIPKVSRTPKADKPGLETETQVEETELIESIPEPAANLTIPQDLRICERSEKDKAKQQLPDGSVVESMNPIVIETAKMLSEPTVSTEHFISTVSPPPPATLALEAVPIKEKGTRKPKPKANLNKQKKTPTKLELAKTGRSCKPEQIKPEPA